MSTGYSGSILPVVGRVNFPLAKNQERQTKNLKERHRFCVFILTESIKCEGSHEQGTTQNSKFKKVPNAKNQIVCVFVLTQIQACFKIKWEAGSMHTTVVQFQTFVKVQLWTVIHLQRI